jgi:glycerophosphoryl diester phosphodiesterase
MPLKFNGWNMLDRSAFFRPIAHRGLHDLKRSRIENTEPAFAAAIAGNYGIECDLQPLSDGTPVVFHDEKLDRLIEGKGRIDQFSRGQCKKLRYKAELGGAKTGIITYADFLDLVAGRVPLLVEIKSEWRPLPVAFLRHIAELSRAYRGPLALMSFDPAVMVAVRDLAPGIPRGIVAGEYLPAKEGGDGWWLDQLGPDRAYALTHLLECGPVAPQFISYHVKALPNPVTRFLREGLNMALFCWTVRTQEDRATAAQYADAPTFEGFEP